jgi:hypothetical protein
MLKSNFVIHSGIVDQRVQSSGQPNRFVYHARAIRCRRKLGRDHMTPGATALKLSLKLFRRSLVSIDNHRNSAFPGSFARNGRTDSFSTAGDE